MKAVDDWRRQQDDIAVRNEAIRRLTMMALTASPSIVKTEGEKRNEPGGNRRRPSDTLERENKEREAQLRRIPLQAIDTSKWPQSVRPIAMGEADGLGIDASGRLHWNGKPVEIVGRRIDLTTTQALVAIAVAIFTALAAGGTALQAAIAYQDWTCRTGRPGILTCAPTPAAKGPIGAD